MSNHDYEFISLQENIKINKFLHLKSQIHAIHDDARRQLHNIKTKACSSKSPYFFNFCFIICLIENILKMIFQFRITILAF